MFFILVTVTLLALQITLTVHLAYLSNLKESELQFDDENEKLKNIYTTKKNPKLKYDNMRTGGPLAAAWAVCFFIYMAYALLPIRLRYACIAGFIFSAAHLIGALLLYSKDYPAMLAHVSFFNIHIYLYAIFYLELSFNV